MKKTLAQLKRDIHVGQKITLTGYRDIYNERMNRFGIPEKMQGERTVTHKDTTGFYMNSTPDDGKRGSFCGYPTALSLEYIDDTFIITERHHDSNEIIQVRTYTITA